MRKRLQDGRRNIHNDGVGERNKVRVASGRNIMWMGGREGGRVWWVGVQEAVSVAWVKDRLKVSLSPGHWRFR